MEKRLPRAGSIGVLICQNSNALRAEYCMLIIHHQHRAHCVKENNYRPKMVSLVLKAHDTKCTFNT